MRRPPSLIDHAIGGSYFCEHWELRICRRCLDEDLNADPDADFDDVAGLEIVRALVRDRKTHTDGTREISPLASGQTVWVLAHQHDHRGATWFDADEEVVWLVAYGRHRSGQADDFFPFCKALDAEDRLLPTTIDYARLLRERDRRFVEAVRVEAPIVLHEARQDPGVELRRRLGGELGAGIAVEVDEELEAITIAFRLDEVDWDSVPVMLAAFHPTGWESIGRMPSRPLEDGEVAMTVLVAS